MIFNVDSFIVDEAKNCLVNFKLTETRQMKRRKFLKKFLLRFYLFCFGPLSSPVKVWKVEIRDTIRGDVTIVRKTSWIFVKNYNILQVSGNSVREREKRR